MLLALLLILLSYADHLFQDFHVEALTLGLCKDLLLVFGEALDLLLNVLDALNEGAQLSPATPPGPLMVCSWSI